MNRWVFRIAVSVGAVLAGGCAQDAGDTGEVAIEYAGKTVALSELESEFTRRRDLEEVAPAERDSVLTSFADGFVDKLVMAHEAIHHPRGDTTGTGRDLDDVRRKKILDLYRAQIEEEIDLSPEKMERVYEWLGEEVQARHILVATRADADAVLAEIRGGADFATVAKERSIDAFSSRQGGLLPWFAFGEFVGIDDAAFPLEPGEVAEPVYTHRGWHVVTLEARRPRERSSIEDHPGLFENHYGDKLRRQRWQELLRTVWEKYDIEWIDEGFQVSLALQTDYRDRYLAKMREYKRLEAQGAQIPPGFLDFPYGPEPTESEGEQLIARSGGFQFSVRHAANAMWLTPFSDRPPVNVPYSYEKWVREKVQEHLVVHEAESGGLLSDPEMVRAVRDAVEFAQVELLYRVEVHRKSNPTPEDLQDFYVEFKEYFNFPGELDVTVFQVDDLDTATEIRKALADGVDGEAIRDRFRSARGLEMLRTGPRREFPELEGLGDIARALEPEGRGTVSDPVLLDGKQIIVRLESVGVPEPMSFDDAYERMLPGCAAQKREKRVRAFLDSLRIVYDAEIDYDVLARTTVWGAS